MAKVATMTVREGKVEKVINVSDFNPEKHKQVEIPQTEVDLDALVVPMSSGDHAALRTHIERVKQSAVNDVPTIADAQAGDVEEADVLETVVDDTNLPKNLGSVPSTEQIQQEVETANAQIEQAIDEKTAAAKNGGKRK